jgi:VCBS repeat-containing protein
VASGTLTATDVDNPSNVFVAQNAVDTAYGRFQIDAAGRWTYNLNDSDSAVEALNVGDTLKDSFMVTTQDGTAQTIAITIGGTNDNAVITNITTGVVTEAGGVSGAAPAVSTVTGVLLAADKDNPSNVFLPVTAGTARYGTFDLKVNGGWIYTLDNTNPVVEALGNGERLTDQFTVASVDGTKQVVLIKIQGALDIKPGGVNPGPAITLGAELVDSTVNEVRIFESRGASEPPSTKQDNSGVQARLRVDSIISIADTLGRLDFDDSGQRTNSRGQSGVLTGAGSGLLSRLGLASRLGDYSLDFGAYDFSDYRFQMGRITFAQQITGRGLDIGGGDTSGTSSASDGREEQVMSAAAATKVAGLSLMLGVAAWALRSGGLLTAMLSSLPAWRQMDLLPIFSGSDSNTQGMGSTDTESAREERAVDGILGGGIGGGTGGGAHGASRED